MMKCKQHPREQGAGVCAYCLRNRLLALQAAQNGLSPESHRWKHPPPILFPRSASPFASHRPSVDSDAASDASAPDPRRSRRLFYHTPQVGDRGSDRRKVRGCRRFPLISSLFHHHHHHHASGFDESETSDLSSWFSSLIHGKKKEKKKKARSVSSPPATRKVKSFVVSDRGMSPVRGEETDDNASESGYSTDSTATWRRRPPSVDRHRRNGGGFVGFTVCLSPLVRLGPNSRRNQPPDLGFSAKTEEKPEETKTEEPKTEEDVKTEETKTEEVKADEVKTEEAPVSDSRGTTEIPWRSRGATKEEEAEAAPPAAAAEEPLKAEEPAPLAKEEEAPPVPAAGEVAAIEVVLEDKVVVIDGDEANTVEAIEVTVLPLPSPSEVTPAAEEPAAPAVPAAAEETPAAPAAETEAAPEEPPEEVFLWGVPLLGDEKSDTILLKFLRARDFRVKEAMTMIKNAVIWRNQFGIESLVEEDLEIPELEKVVFNHGFDKEGHPVCYNVFGEFQNKELYAKAFGDEEKREKFLRWRIQFLEKGIRQQLDFTPGGVCSMVQVTDLKNTVGPGKNELRIATKKALTLLQDNYPEFLAKQVFINVPWWWLAYNRVISSVFTQRSKSKFVYAGPSKSTETLFKYIVPEQVPVQYGGLSKENDPDFTTADAVTEVTIKPAGKHTIEIPATEGGVLVWELRVLGWEVSYGAEFAPTAEDGYTVIVQKARKFVLADEPYVKNSFKIGEPGKVVLTIENATSKKKKLLYRFKEKSSTEST